MLSLWPTAAAHHLTIRAQEGQAGEGRLLSKSPSDPWERKPQHPAGSMGLQGAREGGGVDTEAQGSSWGRAGRSLAPATWSL